MTIRDRIIRMLTTTAVALVAAANKLADAKVDK